MSAVPLILVVGGDALAIRVCEELLATQGHRVTLLWMHDGELAAKLARLGCDFVAHAPDDYEALRLAGIGEAASVVALSDDDRLNLEVALKARDLNPAVRVVLRQFNRTLGRKLEQNLRDCSVLSLAAHSAATFVGRALDPSCYQALQFPDVDGVQLGFAERSAAELGVAGLTVQAAQHRLRVRILAAGGATRVSPDRVLDAGELATVFARVERLVASGAGFAGARSGGPSLARLRAAAAARRLRRLTMGDPILRRFIAATAVIFVLAVVYFTFALGTDPLTAFYFVATTFTSTGYGDITPLGHGALAMVLANLVMFTGVAAVGILIAFATAALTRAQFTSIQGLRRIRTRGHVLVAGSGNVGTRVVDYLLALGKKVVVVERQPDPVLIEMSRAHRIELLTGDATRDATLNLCNVPAVSAVVAVTDSDTANLEVVLGARARNAGVPVVMRVQDEAFAGSIARQFEAIPTYSTIALAAPAFAGVARFAGTRGRVELGGASYDIREALQGEVPRPPVPQDCIPLGVWRNAGDVPSGEFVHINTFEELEPFDRLLFLARTV